MNTIINTEEFNKLSIEEAKAEIIKLALQVPDDKREDVIAGIKQIVAEES